MSTRVSTLPDGTHTDPGQPGLQLRVRTGANGRTSRTWLLRFKFRGEESRIALGHFPQTSLEAARADARTAREQASRGIDPRRAAPRRKAVRTALPLSAAPAGDQHSIEFLASEFIERHVKERHKRPEYVQSLLARDVLPEWKGRDARTIKPREIIDLLDKVVARGSGVMANRTAGLLGQLFKFGIHRQIVEVSPVQLLFRPGGIERPRQRVLDDEELAALLGNLQEITKRAPRTGIAIRLILLTAVRRSELVEARWSELDLDGAAPLWQIPADRTKTGAELLQPLTAAAVEQFRRLKRLADRHPCVFPAEAGAGPMDAKLLTRSVARHLDTFAEHGVKPFTLHDLRRTVRTGLARLGVRPDIAERILNHAQPGIVAVYDVHQYLPEKRAALEQWAEHLHGLSGSA